MTRQQRRSKSQRINRLKRRGYVWRNRAWWRRYRFTIQVPLRKEDQDG